MWISYLLLGFCCEQTVTDERFVDQCLFAMTIRYNNLMGLLYVRALGLSASLELICNQVSKLIHALKLKCFLKKIVCELKALSMIFLVYENNNISQLPAKKGRPKRQTPWPLQAGSIKQPLLFVQSEAKTNNKANSQRSWRISTGRQHASINDKKAVLCKLENQKLCLWQCQSQNPILLLDRSSWRSIHISCQVK